MFGSTVVEVAFGLVFCYASIALIASSLQEALASALRLRAQTLLVGIKTMLNDPGFTNLARAVYRHALVNPHDDGRGLDQGSMKNKPSYIEPAHFAAALVDGLQSAPGDFEQLGRDIAVLPDAQLRTLLLGFHRRAGGDLQHFQALLADWFDGAMERVSGTYKRRSQLICVLITLVLAILFNIDSIHLFRTLWQHPMLVAQLGAAPGTLDDPHMIDALWNLPIGWQDYPPANTSALLLKLVGWLLTASSALFGAPFWFDMLQRLVKVRGTGDKPAPESH